MGASSSLKVFFDGGCRPNPGPMEIAVVAAGQTSIRRDLGHGTSADAEWLALIHALSVVRSLGRSDFVLIGDAANVIAKAKGAMKCREADVRYLEQVRALSTTPPRLRYIRRSHNLAGIALARLHDR